METAILHSLPCSSPCFITIFWLFIFNLFTTICGQEIKEMIVKLPSFQLVHHAASSNVLKISDGLLLYSVIWIISLTSDIIVFERNDFRTCCLNKEHVCLSMGRVEDGRLWRSLRTSWMLTMSVCTILKSPERTDNIVHCFLLPLQSIQQGA